MEVPNTHASTAQLLYRPVLVVYIYIRAGAGSAQPGEQPETLIKTMRYDDHFSGDVLHYGHGGNYHFILLLASLALNRQGPSQQPTCDDGREKKRPSACGESPSI